MLVKHAKDVARQWVMENASQAPGFQGAFFHGSINWLSEDIDLPATSDVDVMVVLEGTNLNNRPGKLIYKDILLDISTLPGDQIRSAEQILGVSHLAGSFRGKSIILDPAGELGKLHAQVSKDYTKRRWVYRCCEHARSKVLSNLQGLRESDPFHDQVISYLFAAGVTTHILLAAGLRNPTVRKRYLAVRDLLVEYEHEEFYPTLLEMLGCAQLSPRRVEQHLAALAGAFDAAAMVIRTPFSFASDISQIARPIAIDGSRDLIESSNHREAVFWLAVTYSRCMKVLFHDAPAGIQEKFSRGYRRLLGDLGIVIYADLEQRSQQVNALLPEVWELAETILDANLEIEEDI